LDHLLEVAGGTGVKGEVMASLVVKAAGQEGAAVLAPKRRR
jgi:hypothetical protein